MNLNRCASIPSGAKARVLFCSIDARDKSLAYRPKEFFRKL
jgi:hypothetical protein